MILPHYKLRHLIRCHSYQNDPEDDYSQIWDIKFEPDIEDIDKTTSKCAIVGQDYLNIVDCENGNIDMKFKCPKRNDKDEELYTLCWSTVQYKENMTQYTNILAMAGKLRSIYLIQPSQLSWYENLRGHKGPIKALTFHPIKHNWLFSGDMLGQIIVWDIAIPTILKPRLKSRKIGEFKTPVGDILQMCVSSSTDTLVVATQKGLYFWSDLSDDRKILTSNLTPTRIILPFSLDPMSDDVLEIVDGLCLVSKELIASRSSTDRNIYIWNLHSLGNGKSHLDHFAEDKVKPAIVAIIEGPNTKEYFMKMSSSYNSMVPNELPIYLITGDDLGNIWIYDVTKVVREYTTSLKNGPNLFSTPINTIVVSETLKWNMDLEVNCLNKGKLDNHKILPNWKNLSKIVNCVSSSSDLKYITGGMNNNILTIWQNDD